MSKELEREVEEDIFVDFTSHKAELSTEQLEARDCLGNVLIRACPGGGKTEVAVQRGMENSKKGLRTLALMFAQASRNEFQNRVPDADVYTIHSYCWWKVGWKQDYPDLLYRYILHEPKEYYDEVIVDELQDISPLQLDVICSIPKKTLFAVGDPDQSIYIGRWASSSYDSPAMGGKIFTELEKTCTLKYIHGNRRSNQHIVTTLNGIKDTGMVALGPKKLDTTVILTRTRAEVRRLSKVLISENIPHTLRVNTASETTEVKSFGINPKIDLMVMHTCKGRQYRRVYILDWNGYTEEDFNLLYTSAARAAEEVYIVNKLEMCQYIDKSLWITEKEMIGGLLCQEKVM